MISVLIVGKGNVGSHLYNAFSKVDKIKVDIVDSRKLDQISKADVTIIAVSDDAISNVSSKIDNNFIVHTSGNVRLENLKNKSRKGVFYPLQTFSKNTTVNFNDVPFCLETENSNDLELLEKLAKFIGKKIYHINSDQRKSLHLAAVFVNNFTNHLFKIGNEICNKNNVPFEILQPLIKETALKITKTAPEKAQTGPAIRKDLNTIENHLKMLDKNQQEIYKLLTNSIQNGEKL